MRQPGELVTLSKLKRANPATIYALAFDSIRASAFAGVVAAMLFHELLLWSVVVNHLSTTS